MLASKKIMYQQTESPSDLPLGRVCQLSYCSLLQGIYLTAPLQLLLVTQYQVYFAKYVVGRANTGGGIT